MWIARVKCRDQSPADNPHALLPHTPSTHDLSTTAANRRQYDLAESGNMWCQPMDNEDIYSLAEKCWKWHQCEGFSVFRRKSDGAWMHCMKRTGGLFADVVDWDDVVSPPASWDQNEYCNGVYVLAGGYGRGAVQVLLLAGGLGCKAAAGVYVPTLGNSYASLSSVAREAVECCALSAVGQARVGAAAAVAQQCLHRVTLGNAGALAS